MRYTGSKAKRCRAAGMNLYGNDKFDRLQTRNPMPPGQHGAAKKKKSDYALHLLEKQKIKWTYGVSERQLVKIYEEAAKAKAVTGTKLLQLLECRLDNILYRSGLFNSRDQVRQLVSHGHVLVNNRRMSIPSARLRTGDVVSIKESSIPFVKNVTRANKLVCPVFLTLDEPKMSVTFTSIPDRDQIDQNFKESALVEYYSR